MSNDNILFRAHSDVNRAENVFSKYVILFRAHSDVNRAENVFSKYVTMILMSTKSNYTSLRLSFPFGL